MASILLFLAGGAAGGLLLGMIGVGTALICLPLLTLALPSFGVAPAIAPLTAVATTMAVVAVTSMTSVLAHHRMGNIDWNIVRLVCPPSLIGVAAGGLVATQLPATALRLVFAAFIVYMAIRMLRPGTRTGAASITPETGPQIRKAPYLVGGGLVGLLGSMIGAGGAIFMVPFLNGRGHVMKRAVPTATAIGLPITIVGSLVYMGLGLHDGIAAPHQFGYVHLDAFVTLSITGMAAAPLGARLASRVPGARLKQIFAVILLVVAARMAFPA